MRPAASVLGQIPGFDGAQVVARLSDGPTNASFAIERGGERFVLRIDKPAADGYGLDRAAELEVIETLAASGLGEWPQHYDAESGVYLRPFLPGRSWTKADLQDSANLKKLANLLRQVHRLPPVGRRFDPVAFASRYAEQLGTVEALKIYRDIESVFTSLEPVRPALCHNDLVCSNILESDRLTLIDWEWAGTGDPFFDLAVVVQHHGLSGELGRHFLTAYLGEEPSIGDMERLKSQCRFYKVLLKLWVLL